MPQSDDYCVILTTTGSQAEADQLAGGLVSERLAACVQITSISSFYVWNNQTHHDPEFLLLIKTTRSRYAQVEAYITQNHSYDIPEIIQLPIIDGLGSYLDWIKAQTGS